MMKEGDKVRGSTGLSGDILTGTILEIGKIMSNTIYCLVEWDTEEKLATFVKQEALEKIWNSKKK